MTTTEKKWWDGPALLRLERKEGQAESYSDIMDMIYHTYIAQKENYLSHTRFNGGFDKDREDDIAYYNIAMDDAANLIEEIKPKPYIIENEETGTSEERIDADVMWENATINDIADWQLKVNNILDAFYVDMFAEKPQANDFIDKRHIPTINEIERFKFQLEAASLALEENGTIDQHELSFVVSGNKLGLENARKQHAERSNARLTSITSSLNSIRNLKSKLMSSLALSGAKGDYSSSSTARVLLEEYRANPEIADKIIANSAQLKMLNFPENYINYDDENLNTESLFGGLSVADRVNSIQNKIDELLTLMETN